MTADVRVLDDPAEAAADLIARHTAARHHIALTGGSTPRSAYERAAVADVEWGGVTLWFGDERCVPQDDENSNYAMAKAALLDRISGAAPAMHRMAGELGPERGADDYQAQLRETFGAGTPSLDLVRVGVGAAGPFADQLPGKPQVEETERVVVGVPHAGGEPKKPRISFTLPLIDAAREIVFLVSGAGKAEAVARAFGGAPDPAIPASLVTPASGSLTVLLDAAAAEKLEGVPT